MRYPTIVLGAVLLVISAGPAIAEDPRWSLSTSVNFSRGDYGTKEDTHLLDVPFTLGVTPIDRLTLSVTVPYIRQTTQTVTLTGGGVAVRKDKERKLATDRPSVTRTEHGLGDILAKGQYVLLEERAIFPEISPYLKIKFPTADEDKGLGTGEFDETLGVDLSKTFLQRLVAYLAVGYTFIGSPSGANLDNSFSWSIGAAYLVAQPVTLFGFLEGATAISPGQENPLELRFGAEYKLARAVKLTSSVNVGLSDGSPDFGFSAGLAFRF